MNDFKIPRQPIDLFHMPFANEGNKSIIPADTDHHGRANLAKGFPTETQLPLRQGGVAPNRMDFNGILYMLSAFAFWQQSGGMWLWNEALHYTIPNLVYHNDKLWWCTKENGPAPNNSGQSGAKEPGAPGSEDYWLEFPLALASMMGTDVTQLFGNPVGSLLMWPTATAPTGYFPCFGQSFSASDYPKLYAVLGKAKVPDLRGLFPRGYDPDGVNDPDGKTRGILSTQQDSGRNITGQFGMEAAVNGATGSPRLTGPFFQGPDFTRRRIHSGVAGSTELIYFDAERVWGTTHTAPEFRGKNFNPLFCIKHD